MSAVFFISRSFGAFLGGRRWKMGKILGRRQPRPHSTPSPQVQIPIFLEGKKLLEIKGEERERKKPKKQQV